jgi:hypothetical protein
MKPTDEMVAAFERAWLAEEDPHRQDDDIRAGLAAVLAIAETQIRAAIAAEIEAALAANQADSDVTSAEAIWHQEGYRVGLADAARLAADQTEETH